MRNIIFQVHWLVGLVIGAVLAFSGLTGALMAFGPEITDALQGGYATVDPAGRPRLDPAALYARIHADQAGRQVTELTYYPDPSRPARVRLAVRKDFIGPTAPIAETRRVDPYTGDLLPDPPLGRPTERFIWWLHEVHQGHWGGPASRVAFYASAAVGIGAVTLFMVALTGLYLRWPRGRALGTLKAWLYVNPRLKGRAFLFSLHAVLGTCAFVLCLLLAHSGAFQSGHVRWYANGVRAALGQPPLGGPGGGHGLPPGGSPGAGGPPALGGSPPAVPGGPPGGFQGPPPGALPSTSVTIIELQPGGYFDEDGDAVNARRSALDTVSGTLTPMPEHEPHGFGEKLVAWNQLLHEGRLLGRFGTFLMMLTGLAMPVFWITGWMMYLRRRKMRAAA